MVYRTLILIVCLMAASGCEETTLSPPRKRVEPVGVPVITVKKEEAHVSCTITPNLPQDATLWLRYCVTCESATKTAFLQGASGNMDTVSVRGSIRTGYVDMFTSLQGQLDRPFRIVFDYEVWNGEPLKGELLIKSYAASPYYRLLNGMLEEIKVSDDLEVAAPTFVIRDDQKPDEAVAVFVSEQKLQEHGVTAAQYEKAYLQFSQAFGQAMVSAAVDMIFGEQDGEQDNEPEATEYEPPVWFHDLLENTRVEVWRFKTDGTHEVVDAFSYRERIHQPAQAVAE